MLSWIQANIGSIAVMAILLIIVALIIRRLMLDKKAGKNICGCSCGGGCAGCPMHGNCHSPDRKKRNQRDAALVFRSSDL